MDMLKHLSYGAAMFHHTVIKAEALSVVDKNCKNTSRLSTRN